MMSKNTLLSIWLILASFYSHAQVTGGRFVFTGLGIENSPKIASLGGIDVSSPSQDINLAFQNPAILDSSMHRNMSINFMDYYAQTKVFNTAYAHYAPKWKTNLAAALLFNNYGSIEQTDAFGNINGEVSAQEYMLNLSASRYYHSGWQYGASLKFAGANFAQYSSFAIMGDLGVYKMDTTRNLSYGMVFKNIGGQVKRFDNNNPRESVPFDIQIGFTKRFAHVPFRFHVTAHHLYAWNIRYDNPADAQSNVLIGGTTEDNSSHFFDKMFRHLIFGGEFVFSEKFQINVAYNHLRRAELGIQNASGLSGFSFGLDLNYRKWGFHYAKSIYSKVEGTNQLGLNIYLDSFL